MSLKIAVQMDPIQRINIKGDSTFALLLEAQKRGHQLAYYTPDRLALLNGRVFAHVESLSVRDKAGTLIVTGSFTGFHPVELNQPVTGEFEGFDTMEASIVG